MMNLILLLGLIVFVLVSLLSPKNKMSSTKKKLCLFSLFFTVFSGFIPIIDSQVDSNGHHYFGFPAEGFEYHGGGVFTFSSLGIFFNFFLFYWFFQLLQYLWRALTVPVKKK